MTAPFAIRMPPNVQSVQIGEHQVVLIDDFLEDPHALVEAACASSFEPCPGAEERKGYPGVRARAPAAYSQQLAELLDPLIRLNFGVPDELDLWKSACTFSLTTVAPTALGPLQRTPHFDASGPHYMAALLYLCDGHHGGTGFYRHNATGLQQITPDNKARYAQAYEAELERRSPPPRYFDDSDEHFTFLGMLPAKFNRLVVYAGSLLHTACVNPGLSLTADPRHGRLTVNTFIDFGKPAAM
ncbi:hypothetical protein SAMN05216359_110123 [Roseateles sp. YR242]|uniref:DUF6445 family protein n=1 Tax=Roseateles sp. YR242 TaxID=1855305 RepID=UPI0008CE2486|nr:DUF6445 family protein [Roseateles sp. YR242]SEL51634.1 hypothetical protein SAMN05216359_110123 [Roseateles sp. YR242]